MAFKPEDFDISKLGNTEAARKLAAVLQEVQEATDQVKKTKPAKKRSVPAGQIYPEDLANFSEAARKQIEAAMAQEAPKPTSKPLTARDYTRGKRIPVSTKSPSFASVFKKSFTSTLRSSHPTLFKIIDAFRGKTSEGPEEQEHIQATARQRMSEEVSNTNKLLSSVLSEQTLMTDYLKSIDKKLKEVFDELSEKLDAIKTPTAPSTGGGGGGGGSSGPAANIPPAIAGVAGRSSESQQQYYTKIYNALYAAAVAKGVENPEVIAQLGATQSSLETGYGQHMVGNNAFGIKGSGPNSVSASTKEVIGGQTVSMTQNFRSYSNVTESASDYIDFLQRNPRYKEVLKAKNIDEAIAAQSVTGYATDPNYGKKLADINATMIAARGGSNSTTNVTNNSNNTIIQSTTQKSPNTGGIPESAIPIPPIPPTVGKMAVTASAENEKRKFTPSPQKNITITDSSFPAPINDFPGAGHNPNDPGRLGPNLERYVEVFGFNSIVLAY